MKIDIEEVGPCTKQLKIEIPPEIYSQEEEDAYRELGKKVKIPGFRKGKIPKSYLKKLYHDSIKGDVLNKIIPESYYKASPLSLFCQQAPGALFLNHYLFPVLSGELLFALIDSILSGFFPWTV